VEPDLGCEGEPAAVGGVEGSDVFERLGSPLVPRDQHVSGEGLAGLDRRQHVADAGPPDLLDGLPRLLGEVSQARQPRRPPEEAVGGVHERATPNVVPGERVTDPAVAVVGALSGEFSDAEPVVTELFVWKSPLLHATESEVLAPALLGRLAEEFEEVAVVHHEHVGVGLREPIFENLEEYVGRGP